MDHEKIMIECLSMATSQGFKGAEARTEAAKMFALITGRSYESVIGGRMPTTAPPQDASWVPTGSGPKAEVVGKDGNIPGFTDYLKDQ
jgi:hypothetical protein